ncbi:MAG TPA: TldD/PmbA family protein [bacterium]|nr:TldD/PmbA family protein [bacterium]
MEKLIELAGRACEAAVAAGAKEADAVVSDGRSVSLEIERNSVKTCDVEYDAGYCVRAICRGGVGYARGRGLEEAAVLEAGAAAAAMACEAQPDPDFVALPEPAGKISSPEGMFDPAVAGFEPSKLIEWGLSSVEAALGVDPELIVRFGAGASSAKYALANSRGVRVCEEGTYVSLFSMVVARRGDDVGSYYDYSQARVLGDIEQPGVVAKKAAEKALSFLGGRKMESGAFPVVFGPLAAYDFIRGVVGAASAEEIQRGRSYLAGKRAVRIASDVLTVEEDPFAAAGLYSSAHDGEGTPRVRAELIASGELTSYLHNSYTANKAGEKNNGHASRGSYSSDVGVGFTNMSIRPGAEKEADMISRIGDGLYVFMASASPNPVSGQISGTVDFGFRIKNGELAWPVRNVMLGGEVFDWLNSVEAVSSDYREEKGNIMPSLLFGNLHVSGGA